MNVSYMKIHQNSHLLFTPQAFYNNEVFVPADPDIPPAQCDELATGCEFTLLEGDFSMGIELYHKWMTGLATYKEGYTNLFQNMNWKSMIETNGKGESYGIEFIAQKNYGDLTGYLSYSLSKSTRNYEGINYGRTYLYEYDRRHCGSVSLNYKLSNTISVSLTWIYQTGLPYTPAIGRYYAQSIYNFYYEALVYGEKNSDRMKDYHRLDCAIMWDRYNKKSKFKSTWTLSVYNLYNRHNPYFYYYHHDLSPEIIPDPSKPVSLIQMSYFPIIPSISYKIYFNYNRSDKKTTFKQKLQNWLYYDY